MPGLRLSANNDTRQLTLTTRLGHPGTTEHQLGDGTATTPVSARWRPASAGLNAMDDTG